MKWLAWHVEVDVYVRNCAGENSFASCDETWGAGCSCLLGKGELVNVNAKNNAGETVLHIAARAGGLSIVEMLVREVPMSRWKTMLERQLGRFLENLGIWKWEIDSDARDAEEVP